MSPQWKMYSQCVEALSRRLSIGEVHENGLEAVANWSELMRKRSGHQGDFLKRKVPQRTKGPIYSLNVLRDYVLKSQQYA